MELSNHMKVVIPLLAERVRGLSSPHSNEELLCHCSSQAGPGGAKAGMTLRNRKEQPWGYSIPKRPRKTGPSLGRQPTVDIASPGVRGEGGARDLDQPLPRKSL